MSTAARRRAADAATALLPGLRGQLASANTIRDLLAKELPVAEAKAAAVARDADGTIAAAVLRLTGAAIRSPIGSGGFDNAALASLIESTSTGSLEARRAKGFRQALTTMDASVMRLKAEIAAAEQAVADGQPTPAEIAEQAEAEAAEAQRLAEIAESRVNAAMPEDQKPYGEYATMIAKTAIDARKAAIEKAAQAADLRARLAA